MGKSKIEWATDTWNPITGCSEVSEGCRFCYAKKMAKRLKAMDSPKYRNEFKVTTHPECLDEPLKWKKPRRIFVCSMSDLFHEDVPGEFIFEVYKRMAHSPQHTYLVLTKRVDRLTKLIRRIRSKLPDRLEHVWHGATVESSKYTSRILLLASVPGKLFLSVEPMLSGVEVAKSPYFDGIDWVICGGESGPGARPLHPDWVRSLRDQCKAADVPFFLKQLSINGKLVKMPMLDGVIHDGMPGVGG